MSSVKASRLVVLMGGTLSPFESLSRFVRCLPPTSYLFLSADCGAARDRVLALPIRRRECFERLLELVLFCSIGWKGRQR